MSRSRRQSPISSAVVCRSERDDKRGWHSRMRAHERAAERAVMAGSDADFPAVRAVSDPWCMGKDGSRTWWPARRSMTPDRIAELLRK